MRRCANKQVRTAVQHPRATTQASAEQGGMTSPCRDPLPGQRKIPCRRRCSRLLGVRWRSRGVGSTVRPTRCLYRRTSAPDNEKEEKARCRQSGGAAAYRAARQRPGALAAQLCSAAAAAHHRDADPVDLGVARPRFEAHVLRAWDGREWAWRCGPCGAERVLPDQHASRSIVRPACDCDGSEL